MCLFLQIKWAECRFPQCSLEQFQCFVALTKREKAIGCNKQDFLSYPFHSNPVLLLPKILLVPPCPSASAFPVPFAKEMLSAPAGRGKWGFPVPHTAKKCSFVPSGAPVSLPGGRAPQRAQTLPLGSAKAQGCKSKSRARMAAIGATEGEEAAACSQHMQQWLCSTRCRCCATFVPPARHLAGKLGAFPAQTHVLVLDRGWGWLQSQPSREGSPSSTVCSPCSSQRRML